MIGRIGSRAELLARAARLREAGDLRAAEQALRAAVARDPADPEPRHLLGCVLEARGELVEAERELRAVLARAPGAAATARVLAVLLLSQGRYEEGFALFEARHALAAHAKPDLPFPEWTGGEVAGRRILIWPEQGLGDQIMFARFAPVLQAMGADVTLICWPALERLFRESLGVRVLAATGPVEFPDPDGWVMACSLAGRLGVTPERLPAAPYLRAVARWPRPLPPGAKVGLMTAGNPVYANDAARSLPPAVAEALASLVRRPVDLRPSQTGAADFADTAALVAELDLVISVDTAAAHLAGAMGKPCWVLLPAVSPDWRWMRGRADTPWYPTVRLYRQAAPGDWGPVLAKVAADLRALGANA